MKHVLLKACMDSAGCAFVRFSISLGRPEYSGRNGRSYSIHSWRGAPVVGRLGFANFWQHVEDVAASGSFNGARSGASYT